MQEFLAFASLAWALYTLVRVFKAPSKTSTGCDSCASSVKPHHG